MHAVNGGSRHGSVVVLPERNKLVDALRAELAQTQAKLAEHEAEHSARVQELERELLKSRVTVARLAEEAESYQLLLSEQTLTGGFSRASLLRLSGGSGSRAPSDVDGGGIGEGDDGSSGAGRAGGAAGGHSRNSSSRAGERSGGGGGAFASSSLADELNSAAVEDRSDAGAGEHDNEARLEAEVKSLKDQIKALTLYINRILEKLLQYKEFESVFDRTPNLLSSNGNAGGGGGGGSGANGMGPPPSTGFATSQARSAINAVKELPAPPKDEPLATAGRHRSRGSGPASATATAAAATSATTTTSNPTPTTASLRSSPKTRPLSYVSVASSAGVGAEGAPFSSSAVPLGHLGRSASVRRSNSRAVSYERGGAQHNRAGDQASAGAAAAAPRNSGSSVGSGVAAADVPLTRRYSLFSSFSGVGSGGGGGSSSGPASTSSSPWLVQQQQQQQQSRSISPLPYTAVGGTAEGGSGDGGPRHSGEQTTPNARSEASSSPALSGGGFGISGALAGGAGTGAGAGGGGGGGGGTALGGNKLRPLRLVQGHQDAAAAAAAADADAAAKRARRTSWMGWFNKNKADDSAPAQPTVVAGIKE
jgi:hypothetical protein